MPNVDQERIDRTHQELLAIRGKLGKYNDDDKAILTCVGEVMKRLADIEEESKVRVV